MKVDAKGILNFAKLESLEENEELEEYDLFQILSEHFGNMPMFYSDGEFYLITLNKEKFIPIERDFLRNRQFIYRNNYIKHYIEQYGKENFNLLTAKELITAVLGRDYDSREDYER